VPLSYDPLDLTNSNIQVQSSTGGYVATHIYGWTEFDVDRATKELTVTTYGIPSYSYADLQANTAEVIGRQPTVWQRFTLAPSAVAETGRFCGADD
jgi:3-phytase/alkaline phosphatase D